MLANHHAGRVDGRMLKMMVENCSFRFPGHVVLCQNANVTLEISQLAKGSLVFRIARFKIGKLGSIKGPLQSKLQNVSCDGKASPAETAR